jgi:hypothetical protein
MSTWRTRLISAALTALCACAGTQAPSEPPNGGPGLCAVPAIDECNEDGDCERLANAMLTPPRTAGTGADDAGMPRGQVRVARCVGRECRYAFAIDDRCYAGIPKPTHEVDCARSDAELLQTAEALRAAGDYFETVRCLPQ